MEISNQINNYQTLNMQQKPISIQPVPNEDKPSLEVSPEKRLDIENTINDKQTEAADKTQEEKDQLRMAMVNDLEKQSKKTQVEIYLSVATGSKVELGGNSTIDSLNILRDVQKQNNTVAAYATYQENQNINMPSQLGVWYECR